MCYRDKISGGLGKSGFLWDNLGFLWGSLGFLWGNLGFPWVRRALPLPVQLLQLLAEVSGLFGVTPPPLALQDAPKPAAPESTLAALEAPAITGHYTFMC